MYIFLLMMMHFFVQAADQQQKFKDKLSASYNRLISVDYASCDIDTADQIILPVSHGQHITLPLDTEDVFSCDSVRSMIKETRDADIFYILTSYRAKQPDGASHIKCVCGDGFFEYTAGGKTEDPLTRLPIVKADFHEFSYINKKLAVRYLGNLKDLHNENNILLILSVTNPRQNEFNVSFSLLLTDVHTKKGDFERAQKYIQTIPEETARAFPRVLLETADYALQQHRTDIASQILTKIAPFERYASFLLHKLNNATDQESLRVLSAHIQGLLDENSQSCMQVGLAYDQEAARIGLQTEMGIRFLIDAARHYKVVAQEHNDVLAMFSLFHALSPFNNPADHLHFASQQELETYANQCIDVINSGDITDKIMQYKEMHPLDYQEGMSLLKHYGTKQIMQQYC